MGNCMSSNDNKSKNIKEKKKEGDFEKPGAKAPVKQSNNKAPNSQLKKRSLTYVEAISEKGKQLEQEKKQQQSGKNEKDRAKSEDKHALQKSKTSANNKLAAQKSPQNKANDAGQGQKKSASQQPNKPAGPPSTKNFATFKFKFVEDDFELDKAIKKSKKFEEVFKQDWPAAENLGAYFKENIRTEMLDNMNKFDKLCELWLRNQDLVSFFAERLRFRANEKLKSAEDLLELTANLNSYISDDSFEYAFKVKRVFNLKIKSQEDLEYIRTVTGIFLMILSQIDNYDDCGLLFEYLPDAVHLTRTVAVSDNKVTNILDTLSTIQMKETKIIVLQKLADMKINMKSLSSQLEGLIRKGQYEMVNLLIDIYATAFQNSNAEYNRLLGNHLSGARAIFVEEICESDRILLQYSEVFERLMYNFQDSNPLQVLKKDKGILKEQLEKYISDTFKTHFVQLIESQAEKVMDNRHLNRTDKQIRMFKTGFLQFCFLNDLLEPLRNLLSAIPKYINLFWSGNVYEDFIDYIDSCIQIHSGRLKDLELLKEPNHYTANIRSLIDIKEIKEEFTFKGFNINEEYYRYLRILLALKQNSPDDIKNFYKECHEKYRESYNLDWLLDRIENRIMTLSKKKEIRMIFVDAMISLFKIMDDYLQQYTSQGTRKQIEEISCQIIEQTHPESWLESIRGIDQVMFYLKYQRFDDIMQTYKELFDANKNESFSDQRIMLDKVKRIYGKSFFADIGQAQMLQASSLNPDDVIIEQASFSAGGEILNWIIQIARVFMIRMKEQFKMLVLPHHVQIISILMAILCAQEGKNTIMQIGTGEGKSLVIAMLACYLIKTHQAKRIHIMIGNEALIDRDYNNFQEAYKSLGISSSTSIIDWKYEKSHQVWYCTESHLRWMNKNIDDGDRMRLYEDTILIVDEVDNIIIDSNVNTIYLYEDAQRTQWLNEYYRQKVSGQDMKLQNIPLDIQKSFEKAFQKAQNETNVGKTYFIDDGVYKHFNKLGYPTNNYQLDLEILNHMKFGTELRYKIGKYISSLPYIVQRHKRLIGFSGSIGNAYERKYVSELYDTIFFKIPPFLNCCKGQAKKNFAQLKDIIIEKSTQEQYSKIWELALKYSQHVPVLVIMKNDKEVDDIMKMSNKTKKAIKITYQEYESNQRLGLLIQKATERIGMEYRITVCSPFGARGQDYRAIDPQIEEYGGMMIILDHIPKSKREFIQYLGRTARQDKKGQYFAVLAEEKLHKYQKRYNLDMSKQGETMIKELIRCGQESVKKKLDKWQATIEKGILMNKYSDQLAAKLSGIKNVQSHEWIRLVQEYDQNTADEIRKTFDRILEEMNI